MGRVGGVGGLAFGSPQGIREWGWAGRASGLAGWGRLAQSAREVLLICFVLFPLFFSVFF